LEVARTDRNPNSADEDGIRKASKSLARVALRRKAFKGADARDHIREGVSKLFCTDEDGTCTAMVAVTSVSLWGQPHTGGRRPG
jgi:hypothetical protein